MNDIDAISRAGLAKKGSPFLNTEQAAFYLSICPRRLQALRGSGEGPRFRRHSRYVRGRYIERTQIYAKVSPDLRRRASGEAA